MVFVSDLFLGRLTDCTIFTCAQEIHYHHLHILMRIGPEGSYRTKQIFDIKSYDAKLRNPLYTTRLILIAL
jgi:hypothetical protein